MKRANREGASRQADSLGGRGAQTGLFRRSVDDPALVGLAEAAARAARAVAAIERSTATVTDGAALGAQLLARLRRAGRSRTALERRDDAAELARGARAAGHGAAAAITDHTARCARLLAGLRHTRRPGVALVR